jgi:hypothetical protein
VDACTGTSAPRAPRMGVAHNIGCRCAKPPGPWPGPAGVEGARGGPAEHCSGGGIEGRPVAPAAKIGPEHRHLTARVRARQIQGPHTRSRSVQGKGNGARVTIHHGPERRPAVGDFCE